MFVAESEDEAVSRALAYYAETGAISDAQARNMATHPGKREPFLIRDEDVLDTWFSSALWPFSTLGWPDETPEVKRFYPTSALVTGFDIIFFWVARMMMMGLHFMKEVPFQTSTSTVWCATRRAPRCRSRRATSSIRSASSTTTAPTRCASRWRAGGAGPRHQAVAAARREQPQFRDQAVERRALRRNERRRRASPASIRSREGNAQPLDRARDRESHARDHRGDRSAIASTKRRAPPTASSGTSIATGMSSCRSRC